VVGCYKSSDSPANNSEYEPTTCPTLVAGDAYNQKPVLNVLLSSGWVREGPGLAGGGRGLGSPPGTIMDKGVPGGGCDDRRAGQTGKLMMTRFAVRAPGL